jgi:hypothetical protein
MRPSHLARQASIGTFLLFVASCATEPPPRPVRIDPANPTAAEASPLETTNIKPTALEPPPPEPAAPTAPPENAPPEDDGGHQHQHGGGAQ